MTTSRHNLGLPTAVVLALLLTLPGWSQDAAAPPPAPTEPAALSPATKAMLDGLKSENTGPAIRQGNAQALLFDPQVSPQGRPELIAILRAENHISTKMIICQAIAAHPRSYGRLDPQMEYPQEFIEPLFAVLVSENEELSNWAAQALARFEDGVAVRLGKLAANPEETQAHRLAGISALELMPGKEPVLALGALLGDGEVKIRQRAAAVLPRMFALPEKLTAEQYENNYRPVLQKMTEATFLNRQIAFRQEQLLQARAELDQAQREIGSITQKYLQQLTGRFDQIKDAAQKLDFVNSTLGDQPSDSLRVWALERMESWSAQVGTNDKPVADSLAGWLRQYTGDDNPQVRRLTAHSLEQLLEPARPAAGDLLSQLEKETDSDAQAAQMSALATFEYPPAIDQALQLLESNSPRVVAASAKALGKISTAQAANIDEKLMDKIAAVLAQTYQKPGHPADVRREMTQTMKIIAADKKYQTAAQKHFSDILVGALDDPEPAVRMRAVGGLTHLKADKVLPLLLGNGRNLLEDADTAVRYDVTSAIQQYGGREHLDALRNRLALENDTDLAKAMREAFVKILSSRPLKEAYEWCMALSKINSGNEQQLRDQLILTFSEMIRKAREAGQEVPLEYERLSLEQRGEMALRQGQKLQAMQLYHKLIVLLDESKQSEKAQYGQVILDLALRNQGESEVQEQARVTMLYLSDQAAGDVLLDEVAATYDKLDKKNAEQLIQAARLLATLITPIEKYHSTERQKQWQRRRDAIALELVDNQLALLNGKKPVHDAEVIKLLGQMDKRFTDWTEDQAGPDAQKAALQKYRDILQPPPPPEPKPQDKPAPQPEVKPTEKPQAKAEPAPKPEPVKKAEPAQPAATKPADKPADTAKQ